MGDLICENGHKYVVPNSSMLSIFEVVFTPCPTCGALPADFAGERPLIKMAQRLLKEIDTDNNAERGKS